VKSILKAYDHSSAPPTDVTGSDSMSTTENRKSSNSFNVPKKIEFKNTHIFINAGGELQPIGLSFGFIAFDENTSSSSIESFLVFVPSGSTDNIIFNVDKTLMKLNVADKKPEYVDVGAINLSWTPAFTWMCVLTADKLKEAIDSVKTSIRPQNDFVEATTPASPISQASSSVKAHKLQVILHQVILCGRFSDEACMTMAFEKINIEKSSAGTFTANFSNNKLLAEGQKAPLATTEYFTVTVPQQNANAAGVKAILISVHFKPIEMFLSHGFKFGIIQRDALSVQKALKTLFKKRSENPALKKPLVPLKVVEITYRAKIHIDALTAQIKDNEKDSRAVSTFPLFRMMWKDVNIDYIKDSKEHSTENMINKLVKLDSCTSTPVNHGFGDVLGGSVDICASSVSIKLRNSPFPLLESKDVVIAGVVILADLNPTPRSESYWPIKLHRSPGMKPNCNFHNVTIMKSSCPVKLYHDLEVIGSELIISHGPYFDFAINALSDAIELALPAGTGILIIFHYLFLR
jgi:hypothetical protein